MTNPISKILLGLAFIFIANYSIAQDQDDLKPTSHNFTVEVNLDLFSSRPISINYLRFRKFITDKQAVRIGASVGYMKSNVTKDEKGTSLELNLRPGYEWHFAGTNRLSPYIGAELDLAVKSSNYENTGNNSFKITGAWDINGNIQRGFTRIGANVIVGVDVYLIRRLYLGTEIGFGFENVKLTDVKVDKNTTDEGGSSFQIGPNFNSSIRLGFVF